MLKRVNRIEPGQCRFAGVCQTEAWATFISFDTTYGDDVQFNRMI
jgi:hypothetical protein